MILDAVLLAAGASRRMGGANKLLASGADGRSLVGRCLDALRASRVRGITVVLGHEAAAVRRAIGPAAYAVVCADHAGGMAHSLRVGLGAVAADADGVLVCLGDMPLVTTVRIDGLLTAFRQGAIVVPVHDGRRGNPVLWDRCFVAEMRALRGDRGAREMLEAHAEVVVAVPGDAGVLCDADTAAALRTLPGGPWRAADGTPI